MASGIGYDNVPPVIFINSASIPKRVPRVVPLLQGLVRIVARLATEIEIKAARRRAPQWTARAPHLRQ
jgi:hypothetical protein